MADLARIHDDVPEHVQHWIRSLLDAEVFPEPDAPTPADRTPEETIALIREECGGGTQPGNSYGGDSGDFKPPSGMLRE